MNKYGIVIVSHSMKVAEGIYELIQAVAPNVSVTYVGGTADSRHGTQFEDVMSSITRNDKEKLFAFYDLGSSKINLEIAMEMSEKEITLFSVPILEGSYMASVMLQSGASIDQIQKELIQMRIIK